MMKQIIIFGLFFMSISVYSQQTAELGNLPEPKATVTFKSPMQINPFIKQINDLTNGDDNLTEKVIYKINQTKNTTIRRIVSDDKFDLLSETEQKDAIKQSEVKEIIEILKK